MCLIKNIENIVEQRLPKEVIVCGGYIEKIKGELFSEEKEIIRNVSEKRYKEFRAGRILAHKGYKKLKLNPTPILTSIKRFPIWSDNIVGSITHNEEICLVVVASKEIIKGIGIDIEKDDPLDIELVNLICRDEEKVSELELKKNLVIDVPKLLFVVKETVYKMYNPIVGEFLEFEDVLVKLNFEEKLFKAQLVNDKKPSCLGKRIWQGNFEHYNNYLIAWIYIM